MQQTRGTLFSRVEALAAQVDRLRERAEDLERGLGSPAGEPVVETVPNMTLKKGSASAEMHGTAEERRAARLAALGWSDGMAVCDRRAARRRALRGEAVPLLDEFRTEESAGQRTGNGGEERMSLAERTTGFNRYLPEAENIAREAAAQARRNPVRDEDANRPTLAQVIARSNARITRQIAELEGEQAATTAAAAAARVPILDTTWRPPPISAAEEQSLRVRRERNAARRFVASPESISGVLPPGAPSAEQMTSRGRLVVDRSRTFGQPQLPPRRITEVRRTRAGPTSGEPLTSSAQDDMVRRFRADHGNAFPDYSDYIASLGESIVVPVDQGEFPTPAEARTGLVSRVQAIAQSATVLSDSPTPQRSPAPDTFGDQAMAELRLLQNTVTRLNDRLEIARSNMAMLAAARVSLREHEENVERIAAEGRFPPLAERVATEGMSPSRDLMDIARPVGQVLARRPSFPYPRNSTHPHHRPRLGQDPISLVMNMDNMNSFDINFDGNLVFRPISARAPDRELIARCLSMLPGGRDGTPSRWMRLTGANGSRPRRAGTSAGYWVRWAAEDTERTGLRHRSLDMTALPRIIAFDFAVSPPDDECWVRADEIEFYTARTRLRSTIGPWMHSRVRVEPFDTDPPSAAWGTSAHVRQAVQQVGGLPLGHFMRYHIRERRVEAPRPGDIASPSRAALDRVLDSYEAMNTDTVPATPLDAHIGETNDPDNAWLMSYEPAIGQIRASWRAHYRRTRDDDPLSGAVFTAVTREGSTRTGTPSNELWSRDYLDENGVPLPALPVDQVVQSIRDQSLSDNARTAPSPNETTSGRITYV